MPRRTWPLAVVAGAGLAVPLLTRRAMRFPPSTAIGLALAGLLVLSLLGRARVWRRLDPAIAAAMGVASVAQYLEPGTVWGHDAMHHLWGAYAYREAWRAGDYLPVWLHHIGLGQPMPLFYGPLGFWAMAPAALAGAGPRGMFASTFVLASVAAALAARGAVLAWTRDRRAALVAATAFAFAPYRLCDANYRSGVGESWAIALLPLVLFVFHRLVTRGRRRDFAFAALAVALMALSHPISLILLALLLPVFWAGLCVAERARPPRALRSAASAAGAALCGVALAGFFTIPLFAEKGLLDLHDSIPSTERYSEQAAFVRQIVDRQLWDTLRYSELASSEQEKPDKDMPFYLGIVGLAAIVTATVGARARSRSAKSTRAVGVFGVMATVSAILPFAGWEARIPGIHVLQFPWRFLGPASCAGALAVGLLVARARGARLSRPLAVAAALALLADGFAYSGTVRRVAAWRGLAIYQFSTREFATTESVPAPWSMRVAGTFLPPTTKDKPVGFVAEVADEWISLPYSEYVSTAIFDAVHSRAWRQLVVGETGWSRETLARVRTLPYAYFLPASKRSARGLPFERAAGRIEVQTPATGGELTVAEEYFPGWQVKIGRSWHEVEPGPDGLLRAHVERGARRVEFRFDRWRLDRLLGWIASAVTFVFLAAVVYGSRGAGRSIAPA